MGSAGDAVCGRRSFRRRSIDHTEGHGSNKTNTTSCGGAMPISGPHISDVWRGKDTALGCDVRPYWTEIPRQRQGRIGGRRGVAQRGSVTVPVPGSFFTSSFNFTGMLFVYLSINYLKLLVVHYQRAMGGRQRRRAHRPRRPQNLL